jgi:hypothetical protein
MVQKTLYKTKDYAKVKFSIDASNANSVELLGLNDNWKKGITKDAYIDSAYRHLLDVWMQHEGYKGEDTLENSLCALLFNIQGYLYEVLKEKNEQVQENK